MCLASPASLARVYRSSLPHWVLTEAPGLIGHSLEQRSHYILCKTVHCRTRNVNHYRVSHSLFSLWKFVSQNLWDCTYTFDHTYLC